MRAPQVHLGIVVPSECWIKAPVEALHNFGEDDHQVSVCSRGRRLRAREGLTAR